MACCWIVCAIVFAMCYLLYCLLRYFKIGDFCNKYVLVTGCDTGFGRSLALRLDGLGFPVFAGCLTKSGQQFLSENASSRLVPFTLDVTCQKSIQEALDLVKEKLPQDKGLWAIINNAGVSGPMVSTEMCTLQDFKQTADVNLFGPIEICRTFLPLVRKSKGRVVNMTSISGRCAIIPAPYSATKFALEGYSDRLRQDLHQHGVKVSIIEPGFVRTNITNKELMDDGIKKAYQAAGDEIQQAYGSTYAQDTMKVFDSIRTMCSDDQTHVVDAYLHAITSRFPRTRYVVGLESRFLIRPITFLPAELGDWVLRKTIAFLLSREKTS